MIYKDLETVQDLIRRNEISKDKDSFCSGIESYFL